MWVAIGGKQVRVRILQVLNLFQVHPLVPASSTQTTTEKPLDVVHVIYIIERRAVPAVIVIAFTVYWVFGLMFHFDVI